MSDFNLIIRAKLQPIALEESGRSRPVSINDQKLFLCAAHAIETNTDEFYTKRQFCEQTQLSERFVSRVSTALESEQLLKILKVGSKFRFAVLIANMNRNLQPKDRQDD